jgi:hypothetical protein
MLHLSLDCAEEFWAGFRQARTKEADVSCLRQELNDGRLRSGLPRGSKFAVGA